MLDAEPGVAARRQIGLPDEQHRGSWLARLVSGGVAVFPVVEERSFIGMRGLCSTTLARSTVLNHPGQGGL